MVGIKHITLTLQILAKQLQKLYDFTYTLGFQAHAHIPFRKYTIN
jgi:hypothetical protein